HLRLVFKVLTSFQLQLTLMILSLLFIFFRFMYFSLFSFFFFFNDPAPTEIYTLSLHDALPISDGRASIGSQNQAQSRYHERHRRSEEHTFELQSPCNLVCRLLLEKKKKKKKT